MMDDSFFKTDFAGKDGFTWWFGRVADASVWKDTNVVMDQAADSLSQRCKVRIIGYHPFNDDLPENDLPWATVMMNGITGGSQGGMGDAMCLQGGETCLGFFLDGEEAQQPVIMGLINRHNGIKNSISESEKQQSGTAGFRNSTGGREADTTKRRTQFESTFKIALENQGKIATGTEDSENLGFGVGIKEGTVTSRFGATSDSAKIVERNSTAVRTNPSNCKNDTIGQITQIITDFIALTNSLESAMGKFVDPIENLIYDMDKELRRIVRQVKGLLKGVLNDVRDGIFGKLNVIFSKFLGTLNLVNPFEFLTDEASRKAYQKILDIIFCIFEKLLGDLGDFLKNMFSQLIENVINGPVCAAEQFISGMFAKIFDLLEDLMEPVLSGLDWLVGGIGQISEFLGKASNLASQILSFIGCDGRKCTTPSKWVSTLSGSIDSLADDWDQQVSNINILKGVSADLTKIGDDASKSIGNFFGSDEFEQTSYNGSNLSSLLKATDRLTGGDSAGALNRGLGSIESAISTTSLFGNNTIFNSCTQKVNNPTSQRDLIGMPPGFVFDKCIAPEIQISGKGSGATAIPIVNEFGKIIAAQITNPGSGYDSSTTASVIDNTNNGRNASLKPIIENGQVKTIAVMIAGFGYCPNLAPVPPNPVGIITGIYVDRPGIGYTDGDIIVIPLPQIGEDTINPDGPNTDPPLVSLPGVVLDPTGPTQPGIIRDGETPVYVVAPVPTEGNGSIIDVRIPTNMNAEYNFIPKITINSKNGVGANLIPILAYKQLENVDTSGVARSGLVGITSVIDCI
tara:strand:+ start:172 stop:2565 length:2394 start_codon:yes stop_codon:yes gene_type:complete